MGFLEWLFKGSVERGRRSQGPAPTSTHLAVAEHGEQRSPPAIAVDLPFRSCVHGNVSFEQPSEWQKVYDPTYSIYPIDALNLIDGLSSEVLKSPCLTVIIGKRWNGEPSEGFQSYLKALPQNFSGFELESSSQWDSVGDVQRFEYTYTFQRVGHEWKSVGFFAIRPGGVFCHLDGSCVRFDWAKWEPTLRRFASSATLL